MSSQPIEVRIINMRQAAVAELHRLADEIEENESEVLRVEYDRESREGTDPSGMVVIHVPTGVENFRIRYKAKVE